MLHLSIERLAALADQEPTPAEAGHLAECALCAGERAAHRALLQAARAERTPEAHALAMPLTRWESLAPQLRAEGLVAAGGEVAGEASTLDGRPAAAAVRHRRWAQRARSRTLLRAAAAVLLVAGGMILGRATAPQTGRSLADNGTQRPVKTGPAGERATGDVPAATFASLEEAMQAQRQAELTYQQATAFLAQRDSSVSAGDSPDAYRVRLAALDRVGRTMREALRDAPYDPVINGYYLTTLGQREVTLRQLNTSLPGEVRLNSF